MRNMHIYSVGVFGGSGYSGLEVTRLLLAHPGVALRFVAGDRWAGQLVSEHVESAPKGLRFVSSDQALELASGCDAILLATPADVSASLAPKLLAMGARVIDFSGALRLNDEALRRQHYQSPSTLGAVYGLPELYRSQIRTARIVANPGCYPTAVTLALTPLLERQLVLPESLVVSAVSGVSGAGRKASEEFGFVEISGDVRAYRVLGHQHEPEIAQVLSERGGAAVSLTFTPHLVPIERGILATCYAELRAPSHANEVRELFIARYANEPFIAIEPSAESVRLHRVVGTNRCSIGVAVDGKRIVVVSAIDNLIKGAAGQAIQNLNLVLGCEEQTGLSQLRRFFQ